MLTRFTGTAEINLFLPDFMGSASRLAGEPLQADAAPFRPDGFYVPDANHFRSDDEFDPNNNPFDPPRDVSRFVGNGAPVADDSAALNAQTFKLFHDAISSSHAAAHTFIGGTDPSNPAHHGTLWDPHTSFRDPMVYFLHSNLDRIWATWQRKDPTRVDPAHVYDHTPGDWSRDPELGFGDVLSGAPWWGV